MRRSGRSTNAKLPNALRPSNRRTINGANEKGGTDIGYRMTGKKERMDQGDGISDAAMRSPARTLLPSLREYLASDEGRRDYAEWRKMQGG